MNTIDLFKKEGFPALQKLGIKIKAYPARKLNILNYDQINSPKFHPVVIECRSLIVSDDFKIVSRAFDRFFNIGEQNDLKLDWEKAVVFEKLDGSLVKLFYDPYMEVWEVSTRGTLAEGLCSDTGKTYRELILKTIGLENLEKVNLNRSLTYIFEFIGPDNRIVTPYEKNELVLIGIRNNESGLEFTIAQFRQVLIELEKNGILTRLPVVYKLNSLESVKKALEELKDLDEGFVVFDGTFRMKVKNARYVLVHHMKGNKKMTDTDVIGMVLSNESDEYLTYFPEQKDLFEKWKSLHVEFEKTLSETWSKLNTISNQKEFALEAKKYFFANTLFIARKKNVSILEAFSSLSLEHRVNQLKLVSEKI